MASEKEFKDKLVKKLGKLFPNSIVLVNDPSSFQGIPDLLILFRDKWAILEVKKSAKARHRPNQDFWVGVAYGMSYGNFIFPENELEILNELKDFFK